MSDWDRTTCTLLHPLLTLTDISKYDGHCHWFWRMSVQELNRFKCLCLTYLSPVKQGHKWYKSFERRWMVMMMMLLSWLSLDVGDWHLISLMSLKQLALTPYYMKLPAEWDVDGYTIADQLVFKPEQWPTKLSFFFKLKLAIYEELGIL